MIVIFMRDNSEKGNVDIARYYATRGKLVGVDEEHEALFCLPKGVSGYRGSPLGSESRYKDDRL